MFRVRDLDNRMWVVADGDETSPTAEAKKDATIFQGEKWLEYWGAWEGVEIVPLGEDEISNRAGQPRLEGF